MLYCVILYDIVIFLASFAVFLQKNPDILLQ